jgi:hypothetical protein
MAELRLPSEALDRDGHGVMAPAEGEVRGVGAVVANEPSWLSCPYHNLLVASSCTPFVVSVAEAAAEVVRIAYLNWSLLMALHCTCSLSCCWPHK